MTKKMAKAKENMYQTVLMPAMLYRLETGAMTKNTGSNVRGGINEHEIFVSNNEAGQDSIRVRGTSHAQVGQFSDRYMRGSRG